MIADAGDEITFGTGWTFVSIEVVNGRVQRIFRSGTATVQVIGPLDWMNPYITGDINGTGDVTTGDALEILCALTQPDLFNAQGMLVNPAGVPSSDFRFYDPNEDGTSTAADALFIINVLLLQAFEASGEGEANTIGSGLLDSKKADVPRPSTDADVAAAGQSQQ